MFKQIENNFTINDFLSNKVKPTISMFGSQTYDAKSEEFDFLSNCNIVYKDTDGKFNKETINENKPEITIENIMIFGTQSYEIVETFKLTEDANEGDTVIHINKLDGIEVGTNIMIIGYDFSSKVKSINTDDTSIELETALDKDVTSDTLIKKLYKSPIYNINLENLVSKISDKIESLKDENNLDFVKRIELIIYVSSEKYNIKTTPISYIFTNNDVSFMQETNLDTINYIANTTIAKINELTDKVNNS